MNKPKTIYIIRHCDKTDEQTDDLCSDEGYKRANALAGFTGTCVKTPNHCNNECTGTFALKGDLGYFPNLLQGTIPVLIAITSQNDDDAIPVHTAGVHCSSSNRFCLLLNPLSKRYGVRINKNPNEVFCVDDNKKIAQTILNSSFYNDKTIIIAAHSKGIPDLVNAFSPKSSKYSLPLDTWPTKKKEKNRFDLVFKLDFEKEHPKPKLTISTMNLNIGIDSDLNDKIPFALKENFMLFGNKSITKYVLISLVVVLLLILLIFVMYKMKSRKY